MCYSKNTIHENSVIKNLLFNLFQIFFDLVVDNYIDGGPGQCTDGSGRGPNTWSSDLPAFLFTSTSYSDCASACTVLDGCVAFDIQVNDACQLRFASKDSLFASPNPSNYWDWWQGSCENNCGSNYAGRGGAQGRCWIKQKAISSGLYK